jgi:predicted SAM-dependent methyltransferase
MRIVSRVVEALPREIRTHKVISQLKESAAVKLIRRAARIATRHNPRVIYQYMKANSIRKLQIGCGYRRIAGWLNCDIDPMRDAIILDAARPLPFESNTFDYIYCEHVIEHMAFDVGQSMLKECNRVLRPGGTLRLATPDVRFLLNLYRADRSSLEAKYIEWSCLNYIGKKAPHTALGVINNFVRDWGHVFIYDPETLRTSMRTAGFQEIVPAKIGESERPALSGLENVARMPSGFYELETFIFEATKP